MGKARLLGSVCALALVFAVPAFAAGTTTGDMTSGTSANQAATHNNGPGMNGGTTGTTNPNASAGTTTGMNNGGTTADMNNSGLHNGMSSGAAGSGNAGRSAAGMNGSGSMSGMNNGTSGSGNAGTSTTGMNNGGANGSGSGMNANNQHHWTHHAMRSSRNGETDTSQNGDVSHLNDESLQAARQGHAYQVGSEGSGDNGMNSGQMGNGSMSSGSGNMTR